jgi:hypothetical protein
MIKPGTLCLIIQSVTVPEIVGQECTVTQSYDKDRCYNPDGSIEDAEGVQVELRDGTLGIIPEPNLLPISPDPDADYTEEEEVKPRETVLVH